MADSLTTHMMSTRSVTDDRLLEGAVMGCDFSCDFVGEESWFNRKYGEKLSFRFPTFKMALNMFGQFGGRAIVETGCLYVPGDFGCGQSTAIFCEFVEQYGGHVWSIDINPEHIRVCEQVTGERAATRTLICGDSISYLRTPGPDFPDEIDLLYLDSYDFPLGELLGRHGAETTAEQALAELQRLEEGEVLRRYGDVILPCQQHCLGELLAAGRRFRERTIVLIDDSHLPGGGKPRLAKRQLAAWGWTCLFDSQQTLWLKA